MGPEYLKEERPGGFFERFTANQKSTVKIITLLPNSSISLQYHKNRSEFWFILEGEALITINDEKKVGQPGAMFLVPPMAIHRLESKDKKVVVLEIAMGDFDEKDIVRLEDRYRRI